MKTIPLTTIEFIVKGKEGYCVCLEFKKTRPEVIAIVKEMYQNACKTLDSMFQEPINPGEPKAKEVKLVFKSTKAKALTLKVSDVVISAVVKAEYALLSLQVEMLDKVTKL